MPFNCKSSRFAHSEGHTDLCYDPTGEYLLTCGSDGEVRIWQGPDDDDPVSHRVGEAVYAILSKNERFYSATDDHAVSIHTLKDRSPDGVLVRFTSSVYHVCSNAAGSRFYAGSGDFQIKMVEPSTGTQKLMQGHEAPILSLALHPNEKYLASSSCDGTVRVWELPNCKEIKSFPAIPKSNDFSLSKTICRLTWTRDGKFLLVPIGQEVHAFSLSWERAFVLKHEEISHTINILALSPCGCFVAAGCLDGIIVIWNLLSRKFVNSDQHDKKLTITGLVWHPDKKDEISFCDNMGNMGHMEGVVPMEALRQAAQAEGAQQFEDLFDEDGDDDIMMQAEASAMVEGGGESMAMDLPPGMDDSDDDMPAPKSDLFDDDASRDSVATSKKGETDSVRDVAPVFVGPKVTPPQEPFQPGSTPVHLSHRFMSWNMVGIIRQYNTDEENSIDVEFHNTATHHPLHVTNSLNHTMAALSNEAVVMACQIDEDAPSKLVCMPFASWDSSKEWSITMPDEENILAVTIGEGWLAIATSRRHVRLFTVSGVQREHFSLPGPVVAIAAHSGQLMIVYHRGVGLPGDQALGVMLLQVSGRKKALMKGDDLPLSPKARLSWLGFSEEGTAMMLDSEGCLFMLKRKMGCTWTQVASLKSHCKGKSDNYFIVGIQENPAQIRCISCKGAKYPATLPRPSVSILPFQLPMCEMSTEKSTLEEVYWRQVSMTSYLDNYEVDEVTKAHAIMPQQETLMKMFALACKMQREARALDICQMMNSQHTVQLAIKYATRLRMIQLAQRLTDVARQKAEEELVQEEPEEEEEVYTPIRSTTRTTTEQEREEDEENMEAEEGDIYEEIEDSQEEENKPAPAQLIVKSNKSNADKTPKTLLPNSQKRNPFKVGSQSSGGLGVRGTSVFDNMKNTPPSRVLAAKTPVDKNEKNSSKKKGMSQMTLLGGKSSKKENKETPPSKKGGKTAFQLWLENNKEELLEENPDLSEADLTLIAAKKFKELAVEEKKEWQTKASGDTEERKRKRSETDSPVIKENATEETDSAIKRKKSLSTGSKLAGFAFNKD